MFPLALKYLFLEHNDSHHLWEAVPGGKMLAISVSMSIAAMES